MAAAALLIPWPEDAATAALEQLDAAHVDLTGPSGPPQDATEAQASAGGEECGAAACAEQQLRLRQRPVIPYSAVVKEVDDSIPFWRVAELCWSCNPFRGCQYKALVLLPLAIRRRILEKEKQQQRHRPSYLWNAEGQRLSRKSSVAKHSSKIQLRAFVRSSNREGFGLFLPR